MSSILNLFGDKLLTHSPSDGTIKAIEPKQLEGEFKDKCVGLYFTASWCPYCQGFSPELLNAYNGIKSKCPIEIVWISRDKDKASFQEYFTKVLKPFYAVPFENQIVTSQLGEMYGVQTIPTLVILSPNGTLLTTEGRYEVAELGEKAGDLWKSYLEQSKQGGNNQNKISSYKQQNPKPNRPVADFAVTEIVWID